ncbi:MAG: RHS repeat-associated core domain-containing protein [Bacteroidales bacterium]|nr:RHS repeat-associated core domain-containing protein [Bacteroidales bacterium]
MNTQATGNMLTVYNKTDGTTPQLIETPIYANGKLGIYKEQLGKTLYELKDHLGNVRVVFRKGLYANSVKLNETDYYPFGMQMPGRTFSANGYRFGFNGMEKDDEIKGAGNSYDFGARIYDSRLGRWLACDPLMKKYPNLSPYNSFNNNPIYYVDPSGKSGVAYKTDKTNKEGKPILRVVSNIYIYGEGATYTRRDAIQSEISGQYNNGGEFFTATVDGTEYEVQFEFTTKIIDAKDVDAGLVEGGYGDLNAENNYFEVRGDIETSMSISGGVKGGNAGAIKNSQIDDGSNATSHELNHGFNGEDKDNDKGAKNGNPDIAVTRGNSTDPSLRRVTQDNIKAIFRNVSFNGGNKANVGNPKLFKFDKDSPGKFKQISNK